MKRRRWMQHARAHHLAHRETRPHHVPHDSAAMPLSMVSPGETVALVEIAAGQAFKKRLADLGLGTGMTVRVVQNNMPGPLILAVKDDTRLAIGRGMAHKIRVTLQQQLDQQEE